MPEEPHDPWFEAYRPKISRRGSFHKRWVCSAGPLWLNYVLQCSFKLIWKFFERNVEFGRNVIIFRDKRWNPPGLARCYFLAQFIKIWESVWYIARETPKLSKNTNHACFDARGRAGNVPGWRAFSSWASVGPTSAQMRFFYYFLKDQYQKNEPKKWVRILVKIGRWYL